MTTIKYQTEAIEHHEYNIPSGELIKALYNEWVGRQKFECRGANYYAEEVNSEGKLHYWEDTHGSGSTYTGEMTEEQKEIYNAFQVLINNIKEK